MLLLHRSSTILESIFLRITRVYSIDKHYHPLANRNIQMFSYQYIPPIEYHPIVEINITLENGRYSIIINVTFKILILDVIDILL